MVEEPQQVPLKSAEQPQPSFFQKVGNLFSFGGAKKEKAKRKFGESSSDEELDEEQYLQRNISACSMDEDELEGEMNLSDDESNVQQRMNIKSMRKKERK